MVFCIFKRAVFGAVKCGIRRLQNFLKSVVYSVFKNALSNQAFYVLGYVSEVGHGPKVFQNIYVKSSLFQQKANYGLFNSATPFIDWSGFQNMSIRSAFFAKSVFRCFYTILACAESIFE